MATSQPALSGKAIAKTPIIVGESEKEAFDQAIRRRVSERAYLIYESSGREHGNQDAHWLQAESEVLRRGLEIRESGSWLSVNASLPDVTADGIQVYLEPQRVVVRAEKSQMVRNNEAHDQGPAPQELFLIGDLNVEIDPDTASVAFKDQKLTLMMKKRYPANAPESTSSTTSQTTAAPSAATTAKATQTKS